MPTQMNAAVCARYGPPEVVTVSPVPIPEPTEGQILVRVRATTVGPADCAFRSGTPAFARLYSGLRKPKLSILGDAVAGDVVAIGAGVHRFRVGDRVLGLNPKTLGGHADHVCLNANGLVEPLPDTLDYQAAVSILEAATALTFLRDVARIQPGETVLINGASGSVGGYAVQLASNLGAHVTGVCSTRNLVHVTSLGAHAVIDYTTDDFTSNGRRYDVIFDAVGTSSFRRCRAALASGGRYLTTVPSLHAVGWMLATAITGGRKAKFAATGLMQTNDNITHLTKLADSAVINPIIDRAYPLSEIADAYRYVETGRKTGTVVITL